MGKNGHGGRNGKAQDKTRGHNKTKEQPVRFLLTARAGTRSEALAFLKAAAEMVTARGGEAQLPGEGKKNSISGWLYCHVAIASREQGRLISDLKRRINGNSLRVRTQAIIGRSGRVCAPLELR